MKISKTDALQDSTMDCEPRDSPVGRIPAAVPSDSGLATNEDLRVLLRRRLRFLSLLLALLYGAGILSQIYEGRIAHGFWTWNLIGSFAILSLLTGIVWSRRPLSLAQLRTMELVIVAILVIRIVIRGYIAFWDPVAQRLSAMKGDVGLLRVHFVDVSNYICYFPAIVIVAYGVCIPNTWRRCVLVVAGLWSIAPAIFAIGLIDNDLLGAWREQAGEANAFIWLTVAAVLAVYGSHRIETLRRAEVQARRLGQYVLKKRLAGGGMGEVYLADHVLLRRPSAIKLIRPERAGDSDMLERFEREVQTTATLTHPNTVQIFDYGHTQDGTFYYVMEYLPGLTLEELVEQHGPLPPERVMHFLLQLCGALHEAHAIGLIHRDIKPGNVMICERGGTHDVAKLLDFGLVRAHFADDGDDRLTRQGTVIGTPAFMSPEQAGSGDPVDPRSDIYSLGALAYFLLIGHPVFAGASPVKTLAAHLYETPAPLKNHRNDVPPELEAIIVRCLAKDPADRFANVRSLASALADCSTVKRWTEEAATMWWRCREHLSFPAESDPGSRTELTHR